MKYCKNCGAELNDNAVVCTKCGVLVGDGNKFCPNCGAEPDPLAVICVKCGYELKPIRPNGTSTTQHNKVENYDVHNQDNDFVWAVKTCFAKYSTFSGRARRKEFWYWYLFTCLVVIVMYVIGILLTIAFYSEVPVKILIALMCIWGITIFIPTLAVSVRRLHDAGFSGWNFLAGLVPIAGGIILTIMFCYDSVPGINKYGANPKQGDKNFR